ncbi:MAG: peptidase domain-containing ABC transporter [Sphingomonadales bacterium]|nr:MAG: peptidase domain-containing ABC transporter [Sphingomonadales bacterium]
MTEFDWPWKRTIRPVLQAEAAECGLACLAMIASHHGHKVNIGGLRRHFPISMKGMTLGQIIQIAGHLDLSPRALRLELDQIEQLQLPAILHWDLNHFVVLESVGRKGVVILDPAGGRRHMSRKKVDRHFTGVALELTPTSDFQPVEARVTLRLSDMWGKLVNFRGAFIQVLVLSVLMQVTTLALPFFMQLTIDEAIGQSDVNLLLLLVAGFGLLHLVNLTIRALRSWVVLTLGQSITFQLGGNVFRHLLRLPVKFFESRHVGDLMSRLGSIKPIEEVLTQGLVNALVDALLGITTIIVMAMISVPLTLLVVFGTLLYLAIHLILYPALRRRTEEEIMANASEDTFVMETMRSVRAIKLHRNEAAREAGWRNRYADVITANYRSGIYHILQDYLEGAIANGQYLLIVLFGASAIVANEMSIGLLLAFLAYQSSFMASATSMFDHLEQWRLLGLHMERLADIVAERPEDIAPASPRQPLGAPAISVQNLTYSYSKNEQPVFSDLSFEIPAGKMVAIVGASGCGKSTLMRAMLGLLAPNSGRILIDGKPLGPASMASWRDRIGAVMQDDQLLSGTIADNISFFEERPDYARIEEVAERARIHDTITNMSMRYQTLIGDMGSSLSAGQRQRILLARELYRSPDVLFLDEGTANLDHENEAAIADMLASLPTTRVVISHGDLLVQRADIVLEFADGAMKPLRLARRAEIIGSVFKT